MLRAAVHPFTAWRNVFIPDGDTLERLEKDSCLQAWMRAFELSYGIVIGYDELITIQYRRNFEELSFWIRNWSYTLGKTRLDGYEPPPAGGCGTSPDKHVESMMIDFWNAAIDRIKTQVMELLPLDEDIYHQELQNSLTELQYGNVGCGTCGSASVCSSKN